MPVASRSDTDKETSHPYHHDSYYLGRWHMKTIWRRRSQR